MTKSCARMANAYFVEAPLQLICAIEAKHYFRNPTNILVIKYTGENQSRSLTQLQVLINLDSWSQEFKVNDTTLANKLYPLKHFSRIEPKQNVQSVLMENTRCV